MDIRNIPIEDRLILALDVPTVEEAMGWVKKLRSFVKFYKVGLQLFLASHFNFVDDLIKQGYKVFLDLKLYDIPNTVARAVEQIQTHGVTFTTVHGEIAILKAAVNSAPELGILAVTMLTSMSQDDLRLLGIRENIEDVVLSRALLAAKTGCRGVIVSGREVKAIRQAVGDSLILVTPGIRPSYASIENYGDQKRVVTPGEAIRNGADYIVVGRPILHALHPERVVEDIFCDIEKNLKKNRV